MPNVYGSIMRLNTCCGVGEIGYFSHGNNHWGSTGDIQQLKVEEDDAGTGFIVSTFVARDPVSRQAFEIMKGKYKLLYRTKARTNNGPDAGTYKNGKSHQVYVAIFSVI